MWCLEKMKMVLCLPFQRITKMGGKFIQAWMNTDAPDHLDALLKLSEWTMD